MLCQSLLIQAPVDVGCKIAYAAGVLNCILCHKFIHIFITSKCLCYACSVFPTNKYSPPPTWMQKKSFVECPLSLYVCLCRVFRAQADWTLTHTSHKDTEQSTIEASITLDGGTLTETLIRWSPNEWPSVCREIPQCLPIRCSGRLISLQNEHSI
jgi:hypothetical protein